MQSSTLVQCSTVAVGRLTHHSQQLGRSQQPALAAHLHLRRHAVAIRRRRACVGRTTPVRASLLPNAVPLLARLVSS